MEIGLFAMSVVSWTQQSQQTYILSKPQHPLMQLGETSSYFNIKSYLAYNFKDSCNCTYLSYVFLGDALLLLPDWKCFKLYWPTIAHFFKWEEGGVKLPNRNCTWKQRERTSHTQPHDRDELPIGLFWNSRLLKSRPENVHIICSIM